MLQPFAHHVDRLTELRNIIPPECESELIQYRHGELLPHSPKPEQTPKLSVIVSGCAEIFESSTCLSQYCAYRPIRLLQHGDVIGHFPFADGICGISPNGTKETWRVAAGRRSSLIMQKLAKDGFSQILKRAESSGVESALDPMPLEPHLIVDRFMESEITEVLNIHLPPPDQIEEAHPALAMWILEQSWIGVQSYRDSRHRYTKKFYDTISGRIGSWIFTKYSKQERNGLHQYAVLPVFIGAIIEAMDRATNRDPLFAPVHQATSKDDLVGPKGQKWNFNLSNVFQAVDPTQHLDEELVYPIGLFNYDINVEISSRYCTSEDLITKAEEISDLQALLSPRRTGAKGWVYDEIAANIVRVYIEEFEKIYASPYPYVVKPCISAAGFMNAKVPVLRFQACMPDV